MKTRYSSIALTVLLASSVHAVTVSLDFESESFGSNTPPSGWALNVFQSAHTPTYTVVAGNGGTGNGGQVTGFSNVANLPGAYLVNSGQSAFDVRQNISGSFNYRYLGGASGDNYMNAQFILGNIDSGITQSAGQLVGANLERNTFGNKAVLFDGTGTAQTGTARIDGVGSWNTVNFTWTVSSGTTGTFEVVHTGTNSWTLTDTNHTFTANEAWFGFGTQGYSNDSNFGTGEFDNINITGTAIPEPSVALLSGIGFLLLLRRKKR